MKQRALFKIVKSLEDYGLLIKRVSEIILNEAKEQKGGFLSMFLDTGESLLGNILIIQQQRFLLQD